MEESKLHFLNITGYDINNYFSQFVDFVDNYYQNIIDFYSGTANLFSDTIVALEKLLQETNTVNELFINYSNELNDNINSWLLLENFENIKIKVSTINNSGKWLRVTSVSGVNNTATNVQEIQKQNETIENLVERTGSLNPEFDWIDAAIQNTINEEDYTSNGGVKLTVKLTNNLAINIQTVVGNLTGKNIYGKDIDKNITFENNDLKILSPDETIKQSFDTLLNLEKGSVPQFPDDGYNLEAFIGSNVNSLSFPSLFRQLQKNFSTDDTFAILSVDNVVQKDDYAEITISVTTKLGEILTQNINI